MSKISEFYKKAEQDSALKNDLVAANQKYEGQKNIDQESVYQEIINVANKYGVSLQREDFDVKAGELDEDELAAVAGGIDAGCFIANAGCTIVGEIDGKGGCIVLGLYDRG